jgi:hypothetical protein
MRYDLLYPAAGTEPGTIGPSEEKRKKEQHDKYYKTCIYDTLIRGKYEDNRRKKQMKNQKQVKQNCR